MNKKLLSLFTALLLGVSAQATPITGQIGLILGDGATVAVNQTTDTVAFTPGIGGANAFVNQSLGSYAGVVAFATKANYTNFSYAGAGLPLTIWSTVGGNASFWLTSITGVEETLLGGVTVTGTGVASLMGFENTPGSWSFSADRSGSNANFNFSSTTVVAPVPDGSTTAVLLGMSLTVLGFVARRRRS